MSFCNNISPYCGTSYELVINSCENISINTGLADNTYFFTIVDKFNQGWTNQYEVLAGLITLDLTNYPSGFLNNLSGSYELFAHTLINNYTRLKLTINEVEYDTILLSSTVNCCN